jgi:hypothetical protein
MFDVLTYGKVLERLLARTGRLSGPERDSIACRNYAARDEAPQAGDGTASLHAGPGSLLLAAMTGSSHYPAWPKPAITLSRKDWHSLANGALV